MTTTIKEGDYVHFARDYLINDLLMDPNREAEAEINANAPMLVTAVDPDTDMVSVQRERTDLGVYPAAVLVVVPAPVEVPPPVGYPGVPDAQYPPE